MAFTLIGFAQDKGFRVFAFERRGEDRIRTKFMVRADLTLARKYGIRLQELALVCRGVLERRNEGEERTLTFTEDEMCLYAKDCAAARDAAAQKRKPPRRPPNENAGAAWRVPPL
jgi:hypothetical protein